MDDSLLSYAFPNLTRNAFVDTSSEDDLYNCIAFVLDDNKNWWWPLRYWPNDISLEPTINTFIQLFKKYGGMKFVRVGA